MELEGLEFQVAGNSQRASNALDTLTDSLQRLKKATGGISGLSETASQIKKLNMAVNSFNSFKFQQFVSALESLYKIKNISIPETLKDSIAGIAGALTVIKKGNVQKLELMIETLEKTGDLKNLNLTNVSTQINELKQSFEDFNTDNFNRLANALVTLSRIKDIKIPPDTAERIAGIAGALTVLRDEHIDRLRQLASVLQEIPNVRMPTVRVNTVGLDQSTGRIEEARGAVEALREEITQSQSTIQQGAGQIIGLDTVLLEIAPYLEAVRVAFGVIRTIVSRLVGFFKSLASAIWKALEPLRKLVKEFMRLSGVALKKLGTALASPFVDMGKKVKSLKGTINGLIKAMGRIAIYRGIRTIIKELTSGIKEGIDNLYQYSRLIKGDFARSMDLLATDMLYLKNSLGAMVSPIINALAPAFDVLTDKIVGALNAINMLIARLTGKDTYTAAKKIAKAYNEIKNATIGIDELNIIGDGMEDYGDMFEELPIVDDIKNFADQLIEAFKSGKWEELGRTIGDKFNKIIDMIDWGGIGEKIGYYLNGAIKTLYFFLDQADFEKLGKNFSDLFNNIIANVDWEYLGRLIVKEMTSLWDFVIGFLKGVDFAQVAKGLTDFVVGVFSEFIKWFNNWDWADLGTAFTNKVHDFITNLDMASIGKKAGEFIKTLFKSFREWLDNVDWVQIGRDLFNAIGDFLKTFDFAGVIQNFFSLLGSAARAVKDLLKPVWDGIVEWWNANIKADSFTKTLKNLTDYLVNFVDEYVITPFMKAFLGENIGNGQTGLDKLKEIGENIIGGIRQGIEEWINDHLAEWIIRAIFGPFVWELCEAFGIASPAEKMKPYGENILKGILEGIVNAISGIGDTVSKIFIAIGNAISQSIGSLSESGKKIIQAIGDAIVSNINVLSDAGNKIITAIGQAISSGISKLSDAGIKIIQAISDAIVANITVLKDAGNKIISTIGEAVTSNIETLRDTGNKIITTVGDGIISNVQTLQDAGNRIISAIGEAINSNVQTLRDTGNKIITTVGEGIISNVQTLRNTGNRIVSAISEAIVSNVQTLRDTGNKIITTVGEGIVSNVQTLRDTGNRIVSAISEAIVSNVQTLRNAGNKIITTVGDGIISNVQTLRDTGNRIVSAIGEAIISNLQTLRDTGNKIISAIGEAIISNLQTFRDTGNRIVSAIGEAIISNLQTLRDTGNKIISAIGEAIISNLQTFRDTGNRIIQTISDAIVSNIGTIKNSGNAIINAIADAIISNISNVKNAIDTVVSTVTIILTRNLPDTKDIVIVVHKDTAVSDIYYFLNVLNTIPYAKDVVINVDAGTALNAINSIKSALDSIPTSINVSVNVSVSASGNVSILSAISGFATGGIVPYARGGIIPHATGGVIAHGNGGIVTKPTLFNLRGQTHLIGEAGREAILPLDNFTGWMDEIAEKVERRVSANGNDPDYMTFEQALANFYMSYMEPVMSQMATDMQRQADKDETTVVKISDRDIRDSYNRQTKRDGYQFTR